MWQTQESPIPPRGGRMVLLNDVVIHVDRVLAVMPSDVPGVLQVLLDAGPGVTSLGVAIPEEYARDEILHEVFNTINKARGY